jgi:hypothetical protein
MSILAFLFCTEMQRPMMDEGIGITILSTGIGKDFRAALRFFVQARRRAGRIAAGDQQARLKLLRAADYKKHFKTNS